MSVWGLGFVWCVGWLFVLVCWMVIGVGVLVLSWCVCLTLGVRCYILLLLLYIHIYYTLLPLIYTLLLFSSSDLFFSIPPLLILWSIFFSSSVLPLLFSSSKSSPYSSLLLSSSFTIFPSSSHSFYTCRYLYILTYTLLPIILPIYDFQSSSFILYLSGFTYPYLYSSSLLLFFRSIFHPSQISHPACFEDGMRCWESWGCCGWLFGLVC